MKTANRIFSGVLIAIFVLGLTLIPNKSAQAISSICQWTGATDTSWLTISNWACGHVPTTADTVTFDGSSTPTPTVTGVASATIYAFWVFNNAAVTLSASAAATLTITGGAGFKVEAGSSLTLSGANAIIIAISATTSGTVSGAITFAGGAHKLMPASASNPATFQSGGSFTAGTGFSGNPFGGTSTPIGVANTVIFASGSTYIQKAGSNPFALTAPASVVIFQTGSLYSLQANVAPAFSGRTYADFEVNSSAASISATGASALSIDNLNIIQGTLNLNLTGGINLKGNVSVAGTLGFSPASVNTITFNGTSQQSISGAGTLTFGANATLALNNANGLLLQRNVTLGGPLALILGDLNANGYTLTLGSASVTGTGDVLGNARHLGPFTLGTNYAFNNAYTAINFASITAVPGDIIISLAKGAIGDLSRSITRTYTISPTSVGTFSAALQLRYTQAEADAIPSLTESALRPFKKITGTWTEQGGSVDTANNYVTATGVSEFSDWAIAESASSIPTNPSGSGSANPASVQAGNSTLLTVVVTPGTNPASTGLGVTCDLTSIGGVNPTTFADAGSNSFTFSATVSAGTTAGSKTLPCTISDAQTRSGSTSISLSVLPAADSVVISQVYGGGGNSGATWKNDFIELYNRTDNPISLAGWSVQYASASGTSWQVTNLSGTIAAHKYYLVQEAAGAGGTLNLPTPDATGAISMSAASAKVALVYTTTALTGSCPTAGISDFVGYGVANCSETTPTGVLSNTTAAIRKTSAVPLDPYVLQDTNNNSNDFTIGTPNPRNSMYPFTATGQANPSSVIPAQTSLLTVTVTPGTDPASTGIGVICNLSPIGGPASQTLYDDGATGGDLHAGDLVFSFTTADTVAGTQNVTCTFSDAQARSGTTSISLTLLTVLPIGTVNGPVLDTDNGATHASPYAGQTVLVKGVIYEKTLQATNTTDTYKGFFIQNASADADADPNTSDGIFVFMNTNETMSAPTGTYTPNVGDEVAISGSVYEYFNMTELQNPTLVQLVRSGVNVDTALPPFMADPPTNLADANRYWERRQGMRGQVPANSIVLNGRNVFSPADAEIWLARADSTIALRTDSYTNRAFRDAHPLDDNYDAGNWDGNGYRLLMGSLGIKGETGDAQALLVPARTFDTVTNAPVGGVNYSFSKYRLEVTTQPELSEGPDPAANNPPAAISDRSLAYSIADYNLENLYDYRDNPASGCDFPGDTGCPLVAPFLAAVNPPYDYVPASDAAYQARLKDIALEIINDLHSPDILMVQEVENQDICFVADTSGGPQFICPLDGNTHDGKPDVLQELAFKIAANGGPAYDAAFDHDSSDLRGIAPAFMYRTDRVQLLSPVGDPVLGTTPTIDGYTSVPYDSDVSNPKTLNAVYTGTGACETSWVFPRAPDVGLFRIYSPAIGVGSHRDVYVIDNHFKSGPDTCVAHRTEQAKYNAALVAYIQAANPNARIVVGGDLNVYPRPDDIALNSDGSLATDQLGSLYDSSLGLKNLWEVLLAQAPEAAYSYVYLGMAQTLDQMFINQPMLADLQQFRIAHINSDFPADYTGDVARGTSDHDPNVATFVINDLPTVDAGGPYTVNEGSSVTLTATGTDPEGQALTFAWDLDNNGTFETSGQSVSFAGVDGPATLTVSVQVTDNGGLTAVASATVTVNNVAPTATFNAPASVIKGNSFSISLTGASDPSSADTAAGFTYAFDCGAGYGAFGSSNTATCPTSVITTLVVGGKIKDKDGGVTTYTANVAVIFNWTGFFLPVYNPPVYNVVSAGNAIPVKFALGGNQGLNIFATGYPISQPISCTLGAKQVALKNTVSASSNSLKYDPVTRQYIYTWKTDKTWKGTCRQLTVKLIDGTVHIAYFLFK